jgi:hypothetical protein
LPDITPLTGKIRSSNLKVKPAEFERWKIYEQGIKRMYKYKFCSVLFLAISINCLSIEETIAAGKACQDETCFADQVTDCNTGSTYDTPVIAGARARYSIIGPHKSGCEILMTYTLHPDPEQLDMPWIFVIDPGGDIDAQIKSAVAACFEGKGEQWFCDGPLYTRASDTGTPAAIVAAGQPPCGVDVEDEGPPLYPMSRNGLWGYVTREGEWAIEPRWAYAEPFSEGRASVNHDNGWGVIDRQGQYVLEPSLRGSTGSSPLLPFSQGCSTANIQKDGNPHAFFVDRAGRFWLDDAPLEALGDRNVWKFGSFSGGRVWFQAIGESLEESFGWIDAGGQLVLDDKFSGAGDFVDGHAPAASGGDWWAFIDTKGNPVMPTKWAFKNAKSFSEGFAAVEVKSFRWMYFNTSGAIAIEKVTLDPARQVIGKTVTELGIGAAGDFHDGLAPVIPSMMFDAEELIYIRNDGTEAFAPGTRHGLEVCQPSRAGIS